MSVGFRHALTHLSPCQSPSNQIHLSLPNISHPLTVTIQMAKTFKASISSADQREDADVPGVLRPAFTSAPQPHPTRQERTRECGPSLSIACRQKCSNTANKSISLLRPLSLQRVSKYKINHLSST